MCFVVFTKTKRKKYKRKQFKVHINSTVFGFEIVALRAFRAVICETCQFHFWLKHNISV